MFFASRFASLDRGEPPHIHVRRENRGAKFWLEPVVLQKAGRFNRTELREIAQLVEMNQAPLLESWNAFFGNRDRRSTHPKCQGGRGQFDCGFGGQPKLWLFR